MPHETASLDATLPVSPCVGICSMDATGLCVGCRRTLAEIARWSTLSNEERRRWMREVQPLRPPVRS